MFYLSAFDTYDAVEVPSRIKKEGDTDSGGAGRDPRPLRLRVYVEDMSFCREDGLFPEHKENQRYQVRNIFRKSRNLYLCNKASLCSTKARRASELF